MNDTARLDTTQPEDWANLIRSEAYSRKMSVSEFVGEACLDAIAKGRKIKPKDIREKLSKRIRRGER
jgi:hypothetical protein